MGWTGPGPSWLTAETDAGNTYDGWQRLAKRFGAVDLGGNEIIFKPFVIVIRLVTFWTVSEALKNGFNHVTCPQIANEQTFWTMSEHCEESGLKEATAPPHRQAHDQSAKTFPRAPPR